MFIFPNLSRNKTLKYSSHSPHHGRPIHCAHDSVFRSGHFSVPHLVLPVEKIHETCKCQYVCTKSCMWVLYILNAYKSSFVDVQSGTTVRTTHHPQYSHHQPVANKLQPAYGGHPILTGPCQQTCVPGPPPTYQEAGKICKHLPKSFTTLINIQALPILKWSSDATCTFTCCLNWKW